MKTNESLVQTGITVFDRRLGGLRRGELTVVASGFGVGKSTFLRNVALHAAVHLPLPHATAVFSLEMSRHKLLNRILMEEAGLLHGREYNGKVMAVIGTALIEAPLFIDDRKLRSVHVIKNILTELLGELAIRRLCLSLVVLDRLELVMPINRRSPRPAALSQIARELKSIAQDFHVAMVVSSMLRRRRAHNDVPVLDDIAGVPSLSEIADTVILLQRNGLTACGILGKSRQSDTIGLRFPITCACR